MGSGFERIKEICKKENAPFPEIEFNENYFHVTFRQSKGYLEMAQEEKVKEALAVVLTERQERAIEYLRENVFITNSVLSSVN